MSYKDSTKAESEIDCCRNKSYEYDESVERYYSSNFYTIDIETNGFLHNEPVYIASWLFQNGRKIRCHSEYIMPE